MNLSAEQMKWLTARYEAWGLDAVRREVERNDREGLVPADIAAFGRAWLEAEETRRRRARQSVAILIVLGAVLPGIAIALALAG